MKRVSEATMILLFFIFLYLQHIEFSFILIIFIFYYLMCCRLCLIFLLVQIFFIFHFTFIFLSGFRIFLENNINFHLILSFYLLEMESHSLFFFHLLAFSYSSSGAKPTVVTTLIFFTGSGITITFLFLLPSSILLFSF